MTAIRAHNADPRELTCCESFDIELNTPFGYGVDQFFLIEDVRRIGAKLAADARADRRASLVIETLLRWRTDELAPLPSRREPVVVRHTDIENTSLLLVLHVEILPSVEALRSYRFEYTNMPLGALMGLGTFAPDAPAIVAQRPLKLGEAAHTPDREAAEQFRDGIHPYQRVFETEQPVSLDMFVNAVLGKPIDLSQSPGLSERTEKPKHVWYSSCLRRKACRILLTLRGYVSTQTLLERASPVKFNDDVLFYSLAPGYLSHSPVLQQRCSVPTPRLATPLTAPKPRREIQLRRVEEIEQSDSNGPAFMQPAPVESIPTTTTTTISQPEHPFASLASQPLASLTLYEIDRATRDRLTVLLLVCEQYTKRASTGVIEERTPDTYYIRQYPNGPGAPKRSKDAPGQIGRMSSSSYATLGLAVACLVVAPVESLRLWLLEAEYQLLIYRNISTDVDRHLARIEQQCNLSVEPPVDTPLGRLVESIRADLRKHLAD